MASMTPSSTQQIEELENQPWSEAEELELRAIEATLLGSFTPGGPSASCTQTLVAETFTSPPLPDGFNTHQKPSRLSQEIEALQSLPWTEEEESAVRQVEERAFGVSHDLAGHDEPSWAEQQEVALSSYTKSPGSFARSNRSGRSASPSTPSDFLVPAQGPSAPFSSPSQADAVFSNDQLVSQPYPSPDLSLPQSRGRHTYGALHFLDLEAEQSGSDTTCGSDAEPTFSDTQRDFFIADSSQATQPSRSEMERIFRLGLLSQNVAGGPQFRSPPRRRGQFGGQAVLRMVHHSPSQSSIDSFPSQIHAGESYQFGSFVQDDDDPILYDTDAESSEDSSLSQSLELD